MNDSTWTWIAGADKTDQIGIYGEKGVPSPDNMPGAREDAVGWYDNDRKEFWLFGGEGFGSFDHAGTLVYFCNIFHLLIFESTGRSLKRFVEI